MNRNLVDENGKMMTELELAKKYNVSRITVRNALKPLVDEGLLWRERGKGTFLQTNQPENWTGQLMGFSETIKAAGFSPGGKTLKRGMVEHLPKKIHQRLGMNRAWQLKRLRFADDQPIAIEKSFLNPEVGLELDKQEDLDNILAYQFIERELNIRLREAKQVISAVNANQKEAAMLHIAEKDALLYMERLTKSVDGTPIELLQSVLRPDYFQYVIHLTR